MQKFDDLSRSLTTLEPGGTLIAVIEMSLSSWLVVVTLLNTMTCCRPWAFVWLPRTKPELLATTLLPNSAARAGTDRNGAERLSEFI